MPDSAPAIGEVSGDMELAQIVRRLLAAGIVGLTLLLGACSPEPPEPVAVLPAEAGERALHCYLVLTLTIDQLRQFEGTGPQDGFVARRSTDDLLRARRRIADTLEDALISDIQHEPWRWMEPLLARFDHTGDGQLATRAEVDEFNRHVSACMRLGR